MPDVGWAHREHPRVSEENPSPPHTDFSDGETATIGSKAVSRKRGAPQSGKRTLGNDDASTLLGTFFQLESWELESINNDVGLQTTLQRHAGKGNTCTPPSPDLSVSCRTQPRSRELPKCARTISAPTLPPPTTPRKVAQERTSAPSRAPRNPLCPAAAAASPFMVTKETHRLPGSPAPPRSSR